LPNIDPLLFFRHQETSDNQQLNVYIGISLSGVLLFERNLKNLFTTPPDDNNGTSKKVYQRNVYAHFDWLEIENICHTKHSLSIVVRRNESLSAKDKSRIKYKLKMDGRK
jgi:tyrosine-protein phosphatase non-receptor type 13